MSAKGTPVTLGPRKPPKRAAKSKPPSVRDCGCIDKINKLFEEKGRNTGIEVGITMDIANGRSGDCLRIATYKRDQKKKGKAVSLLALHCPFCGVKYAK